MAVRHPAGRTAESRLVQGIAMPTGIPYSDVRARLENMAVISLAGKCAERRAKQGSGPGWKRLRTPAELVAHHEAAHAVVARALGNVVYEISTVPQMDVECGRGHHVGGFCRYGESPEPAPSGPGEHVWESDRRTAAKYCMILGAKPMSWRSALRLAKQIKARTRDLVEAHWRTITMLADVLAFKPEVGQAEIARMLDRWMEPARR